MRTYVYQITTIQTIARLLVLGAGFLFTGACGAEMPVLHLRKAASPPPLVDKLQNPSLAGDWYPSSPTWFGLGGLKPDRNHTEILATYDNNALYIAFLNIDRSTVIYPKNTSTPLTAVDSNAIWIQTPAGRRFYLIAAIDTNYPPMPVQASGEFPNFDPRANRLSGWNHDGWYAGDKTIQQNIRIPWSTLGATAPAPGARWRVNFLNYNQTSTTLTASTVKLQKWAPGSESAPDQWGVLAFDEPAAPPPAVSTEATLVLRPATGFGEERTLRAGNAADKTNEWDDAAITDSNWNDWDPIDYTIKEFMQYDLSLIPRDRKIISAVLKNHCLGNFISSPTEQYVHVVRLGGEYHPDSVTMLTSPPPVENGFRRLVRLSDVGSWIDFDVTDAVRTAFESGARAASFALASSSGDTHNGKIWNVSFSRADWYDGRRPMLEITFGKPGTDFLAPIRVGSLNHTSVATTSSKNKLTNGTFRYGIVEGISNTTYWQDPGSAYINGVNVPMMVKAGDVNPNTGNPAIRFRTPIKWKSITQRATGIVPGKTYTFSGWYKGSVAGAKADVRLNFRDANGATLAEGQAVYSGSGSWERVKLTRTAPAGTAYCMVDLVNWTSGTGQYMLYSDLQLEEGTTPTAYSETMGVYYPHHPRTDGTGATVSNPSIALTLSVDKLQAAPGETLTYTLTYQNPGPGAATSITITCPVPPNTTYTPGTATSGGVFDSSTGVVRWTIPSLASGGSGMVRFGVVVD